MHGDPSRPGTEPGTRASDADRERIVQLLFQHHADGRLTAEELAERSGRARAATTFGEFDAVLADLPALPWATSPPPSSVPQPAVAPAPRRGRQPTRQSFYRMLWTFLLIDVFMIGVWALSGGGAFWPAWVILGTGVAVGFSAIRVFGPGAPH